MNSPEIDLMTARTEKESKCYVCKYLSFYACSNPSVWEDCGLPVSFIEWQANIKNNTEEQKYLKVHVPTCICFYCEKHEKYMRVSKKVHPIKLGRCQPVKE